MITSPIITNEKEWQKSLETIMDAGREFNRALGIDFQRVTGIPEWPLEAAKTGRCKIMDFHVSDDTAERLKTFGAAHDLVSRIEKYQEKCWIEAFESAFGSTIGENGDYATIDEAKAWLDESESWDVFNDELYPEGELPALRIVIGFHVMEGNHAFIFIEGQLGASILSGTDENLENAARPELFTLACDSVELKNCKELEEAMDRLEKKVVPGPDKPAKKQALK